MMKKALLVVSFGTSYADACEEGIVPLEKALAEHFVEYDFCRAFSSKRIVKTLAERDGIQIDSIEDAFAKLQQDGFEEVLVQPTFLIPGIEYDLLMDIVGRWKSKFSKVLVGRPVLANESDYTNFISELMKSPEFLPGSQGEQKHAIIFMAHGTSHSSNECYLKLAEQFKQMDFWHVFIGTVEGKPTIDDIRKELKASSYNKVTMAPLLVVAGDHARNDMAGAGKESWKSILEEDGIRTNCILKGLGSYPFMADLLIGHAEGAE